MFEGVKNLAVWIVVSVYQGCLDQTEVFSSYDKAKEYTEKLKRTTYKGVFEDTEIMIERREIDNQNHI